MKFIETISAMWKRGGPVAGSGIRSASMNSGEADAAAFRVPMRGNPSFEAAGRGRRLANFNPPRIHINAAITRAGPSLLSRARWLYENDGFCGNAVDEWASHAVGDGIKPRPRLKNKTVRTVLLDKFWEWTEEADADGQTDYYGLQAKAAREVFLAGEVFFRIRPRRHSDMATVPFQLQLLESEMLDLAFDGVTATGNYIRAGIEFDKIGKRVAYHFWLFHPNDTAPFGAAGVRDRVRVPASEVIHILEGRQGSQLRGVPRVARILVKIFGLEAYDDAELERKRTAALFTAFMVGRGDNPIVGDEDDEGYEDGVAPMEPGAIIDLGDDKDIRIAAPADVGGSYEPFQYRNLLKICAGLGMPYAVVTGDVTRGNFSNVRTAIVQFRRRISQWQNHVLIHQLCRVVWRQFIDRGYLAGIFDLPGFDTNPAQYWQAEHLPPRQEWIDPAKDVAAEKEAVKAGFKSRTQVIAERGYDREELDEEIAEERASAASRPTTLVFDTDAGMVPPPSPGAPAGNTHAENPDSERDSEPEGQEQDEEWALAHQRSMVLAAVMREGRKRKR